VDVPNDYKVGAYTWLHADIPVAYDPCTCIFPSQIRITPVLISVSEISLNIDGKGQINQILKNTSPTVKTNNSKFKSVIHNLNTNAAKGIKVYKNLDSFTEMIEKTDTIGKDSTTGKFLTKKILANTNTKLFKFPPWAKQIPRIGEAIAILDLFMGGGKTTSSPKPMLFETELSFSAKGYDQTIKEFAPIGFATPGSKDGIFDDALTPTYDNVLGHFNILNTISLLHSDVQYDTGNNGILELDYTHIFKVQNELDYVINPASEFYNEPYEIKASFIVHGIKPDSLVNTTGLILSYYDNEGLDKPVYRTPYLPLGCLKDYTFSIDDKKLNARREKESISVYLHVMAVLERDGTEQNAVFIGKYNINETRTLATIPLSPLSDIEEVVSLDSFSLSEDMTIYAWDSVYLGNNITTNGYQLEVISGRIVEIESNNLLLPNVDIKIGSPGGCDTKVLPASFDKLKAFCENKDKYNPVITKSAPIISNNVHIPDIKYDFDFKAAPNPFNQIINLSFTLSDEIPISITIQNVMGQEMSSLLNNEVKKIGSHKVIYDGSHLPPGVYFATIQSKSFKKTIKVVKR
jgi:hypothetical protein